MRERRSAGLPAVDALHDHPVVRRVAETARGVPAHLVGGMIRDAWLGRPTHDVDVVVSGGGADLARRLGAELPARFVPLGGKDFAAFRLVGDGFHLDIWDREGMSLADDLARRDFTVNSIALDLARRGREAVVDPHDGLRDLARRMLRATTASSFSGDPLRVLRLARFLVELPGFTVEGETVELAGQAAHGLAGVAAERVRDELERILAGEAAERGFEAMIAVGLYPGLLLGQPGGVLTPPQARAAVRLLTELRALPAAAARCEQLAAAVTPGLAVPLDLPAARLAAVVLCLPSKDAPGTLRRLHGAGYLSRRGVDPVLPLVEETQLPAAGREHEPRQRLFLHHMGRLWPTALALAGARAAVDGETPRWELRVRELMLLMAADGEWILDPPRLLSGGEVGRLLGVPPGPEVGRVLAMVRRAQVEGEIRTPEQAATLVASVSGTSPRTSDPPPSAAD